MNSRPRQPIKVLQVVGSLARGGVETWLMHVLRRTEQAHFHIDFLTMHDEPHAYDAEARALGSHILHCPGYQQPWRYARNFHRLLRMHGPYHIVHCHYQEYSGFVLWLARAAGVPVRIAHSHSDTLALWVHASPLRRLYRCLMQRWIARCATVRLAVSQRAADSLSGCAEAARAGWRFFPCGVDLDAFAHPVAAPAVRAELGLPPDALVMGHIGRLVAPKNHRFLLEIAAHVVAAAPHARLLLAGDGPLRTDLEQQAAAMGLGEHVVFAGTRPDVARLLPGAVDVFVLPSCYEGLGLAGIEAQAAGLPCLFSEQVPPEATVVAPLVRRLSLAQPPAAWARAVLSLHAAGPLLSRAEALACVQQSGFDVQQSIKRLHALYLAEVAHAGSA